jgi:Ca-activated chloride channel homolog
VALVRDLGEEAAVNAPGVNAQFLALLGFDLIRPAQVAWVAAAAAMLALGAWSLRARRIERTKLVAARHVARFLPGFSGARAAARIVLATGALALLAFALTGPVRGHTEREVRRKGLDLVVCIDTSRSMLVRDLRPDRLTRAKREVIGLIDRMRGDRVALVAFAGEARDISPLTHDRATLRALLDGVSTEENTKGGTDLGTALMHALELFDGRTGAHEAIVMLTDGEDLEGRGLEVARTAAERGIRIYVVGMATESGGKIPRIDESGREGFVSDEQGREVVSALNDASLREIASVSGGEYLAGTSSPTPLEELYDLRISRIEGREIEGSIEYVPHDRFQWFLVAAFACMVVEGAMRERRKTRAGGRS